MPSYSSSRGTASLALLFSLFLPWICSGFNTALYRITTSNQLRLRLLPSSSSSTACMLTSCPPPRRKSFHNRYRLEEERIYSIVQAPLTSAVTDEDLDSVDSDVTSGFVPTTSSDQHQIIVPSVRQILQFAIPAIGVWLCSPLLSMIDTSVVGLLSGTTQQAALNPAVAVTDYSARTLSFLYTGTTNMVAVAQQRDQGHVEQHTIEKSFVGALRLAVLVGSGLGAFLFVFASPMTRGLIGNKGLDPEVFAAAQRYVRIRSLGMPAAAVIGTAQAACLGLKDVRSPLNVIVIAALVNLCADLMLVGRKAPWIGGAAGAAWATAFSQYFAMTLFLRWLTQPSTTTNTLSVEKSTHPRTSHGRLMLLSRLRSFFPKRAEWFSTRGLLAHHLNRQNFFQRPTNETTNLYRPYVIPVTSTQVGRCSTYIAMGHVISSSFGTVSMAANQVITSIFYSLIPIADSLSLTMQSFLPGIVAQKPSKERARALRSTITNLYKVAAIFGSILAGIVACIPLASQLFTSDPAVRALVASIVPILFIIFSLHGVFCGSEGILLGQRDLTFLGRMYAVYFAVVPYLMLRIKVKAQNGIHSVGLRSVWSLFLGYQLFRIAVWVGRVMWLQRRAELQVQGDSESSTSLASDLRRWLAARKRPSRRLTATGVQASRRID